MRSDFHVGHMRHTVILANATNVPDPDGAGMITTYTDQQVVKASIDPVGTVPFLLSQQTQLGEITHRMVLNWRNLNEVNRFAVVLHDAIMPDQSSTRSIYKIHRVIDVDNLHRFIEIECELLNQSP